jgi:hypothetical protein
MNKLLMVAVAAMMGTATASFANCGKCEGDKVPASAATNAVTGKACCKDHGLFACAHCKTVAMKAGKCEKCQTDLAKMNVLSVKDGIAILCPCETTCKCTGKADDATKCSCGKNVLTVDISAACKACKADHKAACTSPAAAGCN